jgi:carbonic anhydrase/acetyltransferase-like protein (isoleucine patch superfamily)
VDPRAKPHPLQSQRKNRLIFKPDREILENSQYPAEYPSTEIPVEERDIPDTRGRRALNYLYEAFSELYNRHRNTVWFNYVDPRQQMAGGVWVAPSATVIGNVWLCDYVSIWYNAVLRGDKNEIEVGGYSNIQDGVIITVDDKENLAGFNSEVTIGNYTTIGHHAVLHGCKIGSRCIIGMNSTILEGAIVEDDCVIAAGAIVPPGRRIPSGELWAGKPARFIRKLTEDEISNAQNGAVAYYQLAQGHDLEWTTTGLAYKYVDQIVNDVESKLAPLDERPVHWNAWEGMNEGLGIKFWKKDRDF